MTEQERYENEMRALSEFIHKRDLGAADAPVMLVHAAAHIIRANVEAGMVTKDDARRSIDALHHQMRDACGVNESAKGFH